MAISNTSLNVDSYESDAKSVSTVWEEDLLEAVGTTAEGYAEDLRIKREYWDRKNEPFFTVWRAMIESTSESRKADNMLNKEHQAQNAALKKLWDQCIQCLEAFPKEQQILQALATDHGYPWKNRLDKPGGTEWAVVLTYIIMQQRGRFKAELTGSYWHEGKKQDSFYDEVRSLLSERIYDCEDWGSEAEDVFLEARERCDGDEGDEDEDETGGEAV
ncbi:hypothetical protein IAQ61_011724 [Plenodomus lingam]|uniref:Predicted protein n=1 Tax=Leptosphaeria maculans (strain JN3 / isolate v23.1.3 / race Av1-4-5-6-7-8) TaxID=985895 RepID=E5AAX3_LEPMJ|nr:predicted protein [Plenodomus lingam JN3]KAH9859941.1 hypothetical protein IAQ61_011724 [Plenodomus lingam]CBY00814.1 predicted protein [Plenodomus lingam JN3]